MAGERLTEEEKRQWSRDYSDYDKNPERVTEVIRRDVEEASSFYSQNLESMYASLRKYYENFMTVEDISAGENGAIRIKIPYIWQQIQVLIPKTAAVMMQTRPYVSFDLVDTEKNMSYKREIADKINTYFDYLLSQKIKFYPKFSEIIESCYVYGGAITRQDWKSEVSSYKMRDIMRDAYDIPQGVVTTDITEQDFIDDYPDIDIVSVDNFMYDPTATSMENMRYCIVKQHYDLEGINQLFNTGLITQEGYEAAFRTAVDPLAAADPDVNDGKKKVKPITIYEYWSRSGYRVFWLPEKNMILGLAESVYEHKELPFTVWKFNNHSGDLFGTSLVTALLGMQNENDLTRTQRRDNAALVTNRIILKSDNVDLDENDLRSAAGKVIEVESDDIKKEIVQLDVTDLGASIFQESTSIQQDMDNVSGVHDPIRGNFQQKGQQTATAYNVIQGNASERIIERVRFLESSSLTRCFKQLISLCRQFIVADRNYVDYQQTPFDREENIVPVEAFQHIFEVIPETAVSDPTVTPEIMKQNKLEGINTLIPLMETGQVNPRGIVEEICKLYELETDKIMISPEEEMMLQQQQEEAMMQQQVQQNMELAQQFQQIQQSGLPPIEGMGDMNAQ